MGFLNKFKKKKVSTDILCEAIPPRDCMTLECATALLENPSAADAEAYINRMIADESQFVTLTPAKALNGIRYMQACRVPQGISVQIGLEKDGGIRLLEKVCGEAEARRLLTEFFAGNGPIDTDTFTPVSFKVNP